ncbi:MAG: hypothetical protein F6K65_40380, partial [Moorea sp. SIO3C2]|nr:hypothetical protein [Moorena sp. SIO3C2]
MSCGDALTDTTTLVLTSGGSPAGLAGIADRCLLKPVKRSELHEAIAMANGARS